VQLLPSKRTIDRLAEPNGSGAVKGMEFALVLVAFFGFGRLLDWALGTEPWLTILVGLLGVVGQFVRIWYSYDAEMQRHEQQLRAGRGS